MTTAATVNRCYAWFAEAQYAQFAKCVANLKIEHAQLANF